MRAQAMEKEVIELLETWGRQQIQGTLVFSSRSLLNRWEERLLSRLHRLGGVKLTLFAGFIETITGVRSEERLLWAADQELILWSLIQGLSPDLSGFNPKKNALGLTRETLRMIREFKENGLLPDDLMDERLEAPPWFIELYASYQELLTKTGWRDPAEAICEAISVLLSDAKLPLSIRHVAFIGFEDYSRVERKFIDILATKVIVHEIPWDEQDDLLSTTDLSTVLKSQSSPIPKDAGFCVGSDREWEIRGMARQIVSYLHDGIAPSEIAVVFRRSDNYHRIVRRVFDEFRIPIEGQQSMLWRDHPGVLRLLQLLRIWMTDGDSAEVLRLFSIAFTGEHGRILDILLRVQARAGWYQRSADWADWLRRSAEKADISLANSMIFWAELLVQPPKKTLGDWLELAAKLISWDDPSLKMVSILDHSTKLAWSRIQEEIISSLRRWNLQISTLNKRSWPLSAEEFLSLLEELLLDHAGADGTRQEGVRIVAPKDVKGHLYKAVLVGGLIEGEFPRQTINRPVVRMNYSLLKERGFNIGYDRDYLQREKKLFLGLIHASEGRLFFTRPENDGSGRPLISSVFWQEAQRAFIGTKVLRYSPGTRWSHYPVSEREHLLFHGKTASFKMNLPYVSDLCNAELLRRKAVPTYTGQIKDPKLQLSLRAFFGEHYAFSITSLEEYAKCPFAFFCHRILRVDQEEIPGLLMSALEEGIIYHDILKSFFMKHRGEILRKEALDIYYREIDQLIESVFDPQEPQGAAETGILRMLQKAGIRQTLRNFIFDEMDWEARIHGSYRPAYFEMDFDLPGLADQNGIPFRLIGKVDRVDLRHDGSGFIVTDYKTGGTPSRKAIDDGLDLQLVLYIRAVAAALPGMTAMGGAYYSLKKHERAPCLWRKSFINETGLRMKSMDDQEWETLLEQNLLHIKDYVTKIRNGEFRLTDGECSSFCAYRSVCRRGHIGRVAHDAQ